MMLAIILDSTLSKNISGCLDGMRLGECTLLIGMLLVVFSIVMTTQYATTKIGFSYSIVHPSNSDIRYIGSDNSSDGVHVLRVDGDNSSGSRSLTLSFGNWSERQNKTYTAAFGIVNEEPFAVTISHCVVETHGGNDYMQVWLHGDRDVKADSDNGVMIWNKNATQYTNGSTAWVLGAGNGDPSNMCADGSTQLDTPWNETSHVRYSLNDANNSVNITSDFVWVQVSLDIPAGAAPTASDVSGTVYVYFQSTTDVTVIIYGETTDGRIYAFNADYPTAHSTSTGYSTSGNPANVGQWLGFWITRGYLEFDTSSIDNGASITQVTLTLTIETDSSTTDFDLDIHKFDWDSPIESGNREANWDGALASAKDNTWRNTNGIVVDTPYTSPALDTTWVSKIGYTRYALLNANDVAGIPPTDNEFVKIYMQEETTEAYRPYLKITYIPSGSPFLYAYQDGEYSFFSDFIPGATTSEKEYTQFIDITEKTEIVDNKIRLKITEEIDETTYLDRIYLKVDGSRIIELDSISTTNKRPILKNLFPSQMNKHLLSNSDNQYIIMNKGDAYFLEFTAPNYNFNKLEFVAEGYYIEHIEHQETKHETFNDDCSCK